MFIKFILLLSIILIGVKGSGDEFDETPSSIRSDAEKLATLQKEYVERTPYEPVRGSYKTRCHIIQECCSNQRDRLFNILHERKLEQTCIGTQGSSVYNSHSIKCQSLIQHYYDIIKSAEAQQLSQAFTDLKKLDARFLNLRTNMAKVCSTTELTAFYCEPENKVPFRSCMEKVLRLVDRQSGGKGYGKYFRDLKNDYDSMIQQVTSKFPYLR